MANYTTIDDVAARFPQFQRTGILAFVGASPIGASRAANVVTITTLAAHGFAVGWSATIAGVIAVGATSFSGTFVITAVPSTTTFTYTQIAANDTGGGGTAIGGAPKKILDGQIQNWINETADFIEAMSQARGYQLGALPATTSADANTILTNLNKLGAQVMLGEAIQALAGMTSKYDLLDAVRAEYKDLVKSFRGGDYDKLFLGASAKTLDAGPQMGGFVPGNTTSPDRKYSIAPVAGDSIFRRDKKL